MFTDASTLKLVEGEVERQGFLDGASMAAAFNLLRSNDLVWHYAVESYLMGKTPRAFDLLYWNADSTRFPARLFFDYLRGMYQENRLSTPGAFEVLGQPIDLADVRVPVYLQASRQDHIAPAASVYKAMNPLLGSPALRPRRVRTHRGGGQSAGPEQVPALDQPRPAASPVTGRVARGGGGASGILVARLAPLDVEAFGTAGGRPGAGRGRARPDRAGPGLLRAGPMRRLSHVGGRPLHRLRFRAGRLTFPPRPAHNGRQRMKIRIDIDCSPEEARAFLGWPDVADFQRAAMEQMQKRTTEYFESLEPEKLARMFMPAGMEAWEAMQRTFSRFASGGSSAKD